MFATITVSAFGGEKIRGLKANLGKSMVFFSLSVTSSGASISVSQPDCEILAKENIGWPASLLVIADGCWVNAILGRATWAFL